MLRAVERVWSDPCAIIWQQMEERSNEKITTAHYVAVFAGGAVGAMARAGLLEISPVTIGEWPWATFIANILGCVILALVITHQQLNGWSSTRLALLGTGFCGALTTFSTVQLELYELIDLGSGGLAAAYAFTGIAVGLLVVSVTRRAVDRGRELA